MAQSPRSDLPSGVAARRLAVYVFDAVTARRRSLDEAFSEGVARLRLSNLEARDRGFARLIATTALRQRGRLETLIDGFLEKPLANDAGRAMAILVTAAAQLVLLDTPAHAAISQAVDLARLDQSARRFDRLINAVLRRVATEGKGHYPSLDVMLDCPPWLWTRWCATYGEITARAMFAASLQEPPLDVTAKSDATAWASSLTGLLLPTGSIRIREAGRIEDLPGFADGAWWVQDAAAAIPAQLLEVKAGERVADLCAAPGGKTAQMAAAGAEVIAVDASTKRMARLAANLQRLQLSATQHIGDVAEFCVVPAHQAAFDAVLVDAPCSATGTIRRHPDLLHVKDESEIARLAERQGHLIAAAAQLVKPGGRLVYATCSLEPEEGEAVIEAFLANHPEFARRPLVASSNLPADLVTPHGDLRTMPHLSLGPDPSMTGMDGFYAARLIKLPS